MKKNSKLFHSLMDIHNFDRIVSLEHAFMIYQWMRVNGEGLKSRNSFIAHNGNKVDC